jgi:UDP-sulfoquinovose synthase
VKVLVLGGDGFCGWPCAVNLSDAGHDVVIVDNLSRRKIDIDLGVDSLTPIATIHDRLRAWEETGGRPIHFVALDIAQDYDLLLGLLRSERPSAVVHFAEQRAAPYSMKSSATKRYTVDNNVNGTHNLLCAIVESGLDIHIVHLGTMGVYGYGSHRGATIP